MIWTKNHLLVLIPACTVLVSHKSNNIVLFSNVPKDYLKMPFYNSLPRTESWRAKRSAVGWRKGKWEHRWRSKQSRNVTTIFFSQLSAQLGKEHWLLLLLPAMCSLWLLSLPLFWQDGSKGNTWCISLHSHSFIQTLSTHQKSAVQATLELVLMAKIWSKIWSEICMQKRG